MRKAVNGLMALTEDVLNADPFSSHLFGFCNRRRDTIKILYWHNNGFWLFYRRLEKHRFWWPNRSEVTPLEISTRELSWLLDGLDITCVEAHKTLNYSLF